MKWNVILQDDRTGDLKPYNVFEYTDFRASIERLIEKNYPREMFLKELDQECHYHFWAKVEWEIVFTTWPPYIDAEEIERIIADHHINHKSDQALPEYIEVNVREKHKVDVYSQLRANWERFTDYVWKESQK